MRKGQKKGSFPRVLLWLGRCHSSCPSSCPLPSRALPGPRLTWKLSSVEPHGAPSCVSVSFHSAPCPGLTLPAAGVGASFLRGVASPFIVQIRFIHSFVVRCFWVISFGWFLPLMYTFLFEHVVLFFFLKVYFIFIREGEGGEREGEKHGCEEHRSVASHTLPDRGPNLQPRNVP